MFHFLEHLRYAVGKFCCTCVHGELGVFRLLIGRGDAGEFGDLPGAGFFVEAFHIACFTYFERAVAIDLHEVAVLDHAAHAFAVGTEGGDEGGEDDDAGFHEEFGKLADTADVFDAVFVGKSQIAAQAVAHVVAVQHEGVAAHLVQFFFDRMGEGGFARAGEAGEPEDGAAVVVLLFAPCAGDGGVVPDDVGGGWGLGGHVRLIGLIY